MSGLLIMFLIGTLSWNTLFAQLTNANRVPNQAGRSLSSDAPNGPGKDAHWASAAKDGFGTAKSLASKVWFTLNEGVMTEVYYPTLDVPNVQTLQLIVADSGKVETESEDTIHHMEIVEHNSLSFRQRNVARSGNYTITKTYVTDPLRNTVLIDIQFQSRTAANVYLYYDPSLNNSGMHDTSWSEGDALLAADGDKASALISSTGFAQREGRPNLPDISNGYRETSDGLSELRQHWPQRAFTPYTRATDGNVVQFAALQGFQNLGKSTGTNRQPMRCTLALGFGKNQGEALQNARTSLARGFASVSSAYQAGWQEYVRKLPRVAPKYRNQFTMSAMVLKALEDKTYRGAFVASPSIPWGGGPNANEATVTGYHAVWSRDLYQIATALHALGDLTAANRALDYLLNVQQQPDGSFPQNTRVDGRPIGNGLQMDQVALPIILAYQLGRTDSTTWTRHIKPAADFIIRHGPKTGQDRWEEKPGYSPATLAAEIAGLVCAARIATVNKDTQYARIYLQIADTWAASVDEWTATSLGYFHTASYYLRITQQGNPDQNTKIEINSGGGTYDQREIIDAGFLELVRLGVKAPDDPLIRKSLAVVDKLIRVDTPVGPAWYRYNHDAYGERTDGEPYDGRSGIGRLWTLLTGERGEYELARGKTAEARRLLDTLAAFANQGLMIPEQVWDRQGMRHFRFGAGTGSATPLAWSMAQFIRLAINLQNKRNRETPAIVALRYALVSRRPK